MEPFCLEGIYGCMIRAVIIDDEADARFVLRKKLETDFSDILKIVGEADSVAEGIEVLSTSDPDLVFLDIKMRDGNGFDILQALSDPAFEVIFVTAYDNFAVKAFQFSAFGYIMKPVKSTELQNVVNNYLDKRAILKESSARRIKVLTENFGGEHKVSKLVIAHMEGFKVLEMADIIRLEGDGNYTNIILANSKKETSTKNLGQYEELLNDFGFFRTHQSTLVNLQHVTGFVKGGGGQVEMSDGTLVKLSRYRKTDFVKRFV